MPQTPASGSPGKGWVCHSGSAPCTAGPRQLTAKKRPMVPAMAGAWKRNGHARMVGETMPTGRSAATVMPCRRSSPAGPMPERCRMAGLLIDAGRDQHPVGLRRVARRPNDRASDARRPAVLEPHPIDQRLAPGW